MLRDINNLSNFMLLGDREPSGSIEDFYFDDSSWIVRYAVLMNERGKILINHDALQAPQGDMGALRVMLTAKDLRKSPKIEEDKPLDLQHIEFYLRDYEWPAFWGSSFYYPEPPCSLVMTPPIIDERIESRKHASAMHRQGDPHLRSMSATAGFHVMAINGEIGTIDSLIVDDETWEIKFIVVDCVGEVINKKVLVSVSLVSHTHWADSRLYANCTCNEILMQSNYNPSKPITHEYLESITLQHSDISGYYSPISGGRQNWPL